MRILHVMSSVDPHGGGPAEGVRQRGIRLTEMNHTVEVVSLDDPRSPFVIEHPLTIHALGPSLGAYKFNRRLVPWLTEHASEYDAVVINGIWQFHSFGAWRALRSLRGARRVPYYVFTHGMLDPWFKHTYPFKHLKKWIFWPWADYRVLRDAEAVLFTSEDEKLLARQSFWLYRAHEKVVPYGTRTPPADRAELRDLFLAAHPQLRGKRIILFLSRIHEKKGCDLLVKAFAAQALVNPDLHLAVAGPDQAGWVAALKSLASDAGVADRITWPGMLRGDMKWGAFHASEVFALPSHQENFGIAVAEALGCGLPVLISDKVNIWREIKSHDAGFVEPDTLEGTERLLERWTALGIEERLAMGRAARNLFLERFTVDAMAQGLLDVLQPDGAPCES